MNHYELLVILPGKLSETELPAAEKNVRDLCAIAGVTITRENPQGKKKLAYPIRTEHYGYYHVIECDAPAESIKGLSSRLRLSPEILRHGLFQKPIKSQEALQRETKLRERVAERRATKKAAVAAAASATHSETPAGKPVHEAPVDVAALDKKLEELLEKPEGV